MPKLQLGPDSVEFVPMTHKRSKEVFALITDGIAKTSDANNVIQNLINAYIKGSGEVPLQALVDIIKSVPDLLTEALALGLSVSVDQLDNALSSEFTTALEMFVDENDVVGQWGRTKKVFSPFTAQGPDKKVA